MAKSRNTTAHNTHDTQSNATGQKHAIPQQRGAAAAALGAAAACLAALAAAFGPELWAFFANGEAVRAWAESTGTLAPVAMAGLVCAQVVAAVLPREPIELACGYLLGFWGGTAACLAGSLAGTLIAVAIVRKLGVKAVHLFFSQEQIESVSWLKNTARFELVMFAVFLVPGTPKDVLTYVAGLTDIPWWKIAAIATIGRIPSIVTSTLASGLASRGSWLAAGAVLVVTVALAAAGAGAFALSRRKASKS